MKIVQVEWRLNCRNDEDSTWRFGELTAAEITVIKDATYIKFDGQTWTVGTIESEWTARGMTRATIQLFEQV